MRVWTVSDIHTDYKINREKLTAISKLDYTEDILIVCGDISHDENILYASLSALQSRFKYVFFIIGNHDIWVGDGAEEDSWTKLSRLNHSLQKMGIITSTKTIAKWKFVPLYSWYDYSFGDKLTANPQLWMDFIRCKWSADMDDPAKITQRFHALNKLPDIIKTKSARQEALELISFSHFVPRIDILPEKLLYKISPILSFLGTKLLELDIRRLKSTTHIFGHLHYNIDTEFEGLRYINPALGYPRERMHFQDLLYLVSQA